MTKTAPKIRFQSKLLRPADAKAGSWNFSYPAEERQCEASNAKHDDR